MAGREKVEGGPTAPAPRPHIPVGGVPTRPMTSLQQSLSRPSHNLNNGQVKPQMGSNFPSRPNSSNYGLDSNSVDSDKSLKMKIKRTKSGRQEIVKPEGGHNNSHNGNSDNEGSVVKPGNRDSSVSPSAVRTTKPESTPLTPPVSHSEMNGSGAKTPTKVTFANLSNSSLQQLTSKRLKVSMWTIFSLTQEFYCNLSTTVRHSLSPELDALSKKKFQQQTTTTFSASRNEKKFLFIHTQVFKAYKSVVTITS